jgi:hypothetical protein
MLSAAANPQADVDARLSAAGMMLSLGDSPQ